ncbi:hypothetical protein L2W58_02680 [Dethiosulfovibrio sp. F2B]|uniref:hypothetical protein n=1 Tax=Dethiosulfovibrio faecalis TaxID=2720018 RepID=UPI001F2ECB5B|nr:hypothetical protein [Dethiosulfovibrio faecalis]MCF4150696.1 hypothetical protein [Dethiosulfovibrio faecalis]
MPLRKLGSACLLLVFFASACWGASPLEDATRILENSTSFHWGKDCLVWVVHYPEALVGPWVEADAISRGYTPAQKEEYLRSFREQLRIGQSEPFLVTVYHFGPKPLSLSPMSENLLMIAEGGDVIPPLSYEDKLDQPITGVVQGLVFFPKQKDGFVLSLKGLGVYREQRFAFKGFSSVGEPSSNDVGEAKQRIVELPPVETETVLTSSGGKVDVPVAKPKPEKAEKESKRVEEPTVDTEPPAWLGPGPVLTKKPEPVEIPKVSSGDSMALSADLSEAIMSEDDPNPAGLEMSRDSLVEAFLALWAKGDTSTMYEMLSPSSRGDKDTFSKRANGSPLRWCLEDGYKLKWLDGDKVKVSVAQKLVLIRVLQSEVLTVVSEEGRLWIVW